MRTSLLLLAVFWTGTCFSQEKVAEFQHKISVKPYNYFIYRDLEYDHAAGTLSIYGQNWKLATLFVTKSGKSTGFANGNSNIPFVYVAKLGAAGVSEETEKAINLRSYPQFKMEGYDYEALDPTTKDQISSSETATSIGELMSEYPKSFPTATTGITMYEMSVGSQWTGFYVQEKMQPYDFKPDQGRLIKGEPTTKTHKFELGDEFKIMAEKYNVMDNKRRMALIPAMKGMKGDKLFGYTHKRIYTSDKEGKISNQFDVEFEYPKSLIFATGFGSSAQDTAATFNDGAILIYGRAFGVGKKNNDPDFTRYRVVIVGKDGDLIKEAVFNYGTEKRSLEPYYAYKRDGKIFVFGKAVGKDAPGYAVLVFDKTGLIDTKEYSYDAFRSLVSGPYDEGLTSNYGRGFRPIDHFVLANGEVLVYGEAHESRTENETVTTPGGTSNGSFATKTIYTYLSHVFLRFDADGNLLSEYVIPKREEAQSEITRLKILNDQNNRVYFLGEEANSKDSYAIILSVDYGSNDLKKTHLSDFDVFDMKGRVVYKYDDVDKRLVFLGRTADRESLTLKSVVMELR